MALALVKRQAWVFSQEDLRQHGLEDVQEITVYSGLCTELPLQDTFGKKQFRFIHNTFQVKTNAFTSAPSNYILCGVLSTINHKLYIYIYILYLYLQYVFYAVLTPDDHNFLIDH